MDFCFDKDIVLENDRVKISPLTFSDFEQLRPAASSDEKLTQYSPFTVYSPENLKQFIQNSMAEREKQLRYAFSIFDKQTGQMAGSTSFGSISNKDQRIEIGWTWLGTNFQKSGINRHCKFLLLQYVFEVLKFERLEFRTDERNVKSRTAIEGIGGKYEGLLRSHTLMLDGFRRSTIYYSILKHEWPEVKKNMEMKLVKDYAGITG